jgi:hypothetical protein
MSETIRYKPWAEPGAAGVTFLPKMTEHPEPGGVNWIYAEVFTVVVVGVEPPPELRVELRHPRPGRRRSQTASRA